MDFLRCEHDCCIYVKDVDEDDALYLLLYVDDMFIVSRSTDAVNELKSALSSEFEMKDLDPVRKILGIFAKIKAKIFSTYHKEDTFIKCWRGLA